jgi:hypothetical protein
MRSGTKAVLGTGVVCLGLAVSAVLADRSPLAAQGGAPSPAARTRVAARSSASIVQSTNAPSRTCSISRSMPATGCRSTPMSANFDNIADAQALSPTLLESYLNAAADISRMAVGDRTAVTIDHTYTNPSYVSQHPWDHVEGAPYGTRGGMAWITCSRPTGIRVPDDLHGGRQRALEDIDVSIDGERVALLQLRAAGRRRGGRPRPGADAHRADLRARGAARWRRRSSAGPKGPTRI